MLLVQQTLKKLQYLNGSSQECCLHLHSWVKWLQSQSPTKFISSIRYTISASCKNRTYSLQWIQNCKNKLGLYSVQAGQGRLDIQGLLQETVCWCSKRDIGKRHWKHQKKRYGLGVIQSENNFQKYLEYRNYKMFDLQFFFQNTNQAVSKTKTLHQTFN